MARTLPFASAAVACALLVFGAMTARAGDRPSADELQAAVSDHTYQGSTSAAGSGFAEYYAPSGDILGDGYSGKWRVEDGRMCFQYGDKPEGCWDIELQGPSMVMFKDGEVDGNGMLIQGNPNGYKGG